MCFVRFRKQIQYTGSSILMVRKFLLIAPKIWLPVTFWAYWGLTKCGPFDKLCLWSLGVTSLNHNNTRCRENVYRRMHKSWLFFLSLEGVNIFETTFLSHFWIKWRCFVIVGNQITLTFLISTNFDLKSSRKSPL